MVCFCVNAITVRRYSPLGFLACETSQKANSLLRESLFVAPPLHSVRSFAEKCEKIRRAVLTKERESVYNKLCAIYNLICRQALMGITVLPRTESRPLC